MKAKISHCRLILAQNLSSWDTANKIRGVAFATPRILVEVAGLELAASSTRNWRATTCATPRYSTL